MADIKPASTISPLLKMEGVRKSFGATIALDGVDLDVRSGEVLALVGENGAGKSTLMKVLSGAHPLGDGKMWLGENPYSPRNPLEARRLGVAMIYQEISLAPHLTVTENIMLGVEPNFGIFIDWKAMRSAASSALQEIGLGHIPVDTPVSKLSIAEQQLVEIARALVVGSKVLVLDEPTSSLTRSDIERLFAIVAKLKSQGQAIIYISHFLEEIKLISDRFVVLRDGKSVGSGITSDISEGEIIRMMVGRTVDDLYPRSNRTPGDIVLEVKNLANPPRLSSASLELRKGEVLGISGLVGAGRTELLRAIFSLDPVKRGNVKVASFENPKHRPNVSDRWAEGMGMVSEDRKAEGLALSLSLTDNVTMTKLGPIISPSQLQSKSITVMDKVGVKRRNASQAVGDLSGGNQQKVAVARLLYHEADILLLDEPTRGIDIGSKAEIYRIIDELAKSGKAVLMVSSYLPELLGVCDRVAVMCRGVLGPARPVGDIDEHSIMLEATGAG